MNTFQWLFKTRFNRLSYPNLFSCIKYFKKWDRYDQILQLIKEENLRFRITAQYIYFYYYTKEIEPETLKVSSTLVHNDISGQSRMGESMSPNYFYTTDKVSDDKCEKLDEDYFPGIAIETCWERAFMDVDKNLPRFEGIYEINDYKGHKAFVNIQINQKKVEVIQFNKLKLFLTRNGRKKFIGFAG